MAKRAEIGAMRTKIRVTTPDPDKSKRDEDGYQNDIHKNVLDDDAFFYCKWVYAHGQEVFTARQIGINEPATITMRYHPAVTAVCEIYKSGEPDPYEIISVNDVEDRHEWLELKVVRKGAAI